MSPRRTEFDPNSVDLGSRLGLTWPLLARVRPMMWATTFETRFRRFFGEDLVNLGTNSTRIGRSWPLLVCLRSNLIFWPDSGRFLPTRMLTCPPNKLETTPRNMLAWGSRRKMCRQHTRRLHWTSQNHEISAIHRELSGDFGFSGQLRLGSAMARYASSRHGGATDFRPNPGPEASFHNAEIGSCRPQLVELGRISGVVETPSWSGRFSPSRSEANRRLANLPTHSNAR